MSNPLRGSHPLPETWELVSPQTQFREGDLLRWPNDRRIVWRITKVHRQPTERTPIALVDLEGAAEHTLSQTETFPTTFPGWEVDTTEQISRWCDRDHDPWDD